VATLAKRLKGTAPESLDVAAMWRDVIAYSREHDDSVVSAIAARRRGLELTLTKATPGRRLVERSRLCLAVALLVIESARFCSIVGLSLCPKEGRAKGQSGRLVKEKPRSA
jgi:hypothetical protein